ncbi:MAG: aminoacetone oxidase family FAD-binding enzyme [Bacteroidota bacterium]
MKSSGSSKTDVAIIGGGAAGFFAACRCAENHPSARVSLYEKTNKVLSKVLISGGGRCNVTHRFTNLPAFLKNYPRGSAELRGPMANFGQPETVAWFESRGVQLKTESDGRMFPVTDKSETIAGCLYAEAERLGVNLILSRGVSAIRQNREHGGGFTLELPEGTETRHTHVILASGGSPGIRGLQWLADMGLSIVPPVPSLFTFNLPHEINGICMLMGLGVTDAQVSIAGMKQVQRGPVLVTHWGLSGPAVLKMSAFAARELAACGYKADVMMRWVPGLTEDEIRQSLSAFRISESGKLVQNAAAFGLPRRLWEYLAVKAGLGNVRWSEAPKAGTNKLLNLLRNDVYKMEGKTTYKEEFVTAGGIALGEIDFRTMQCKKIPGLYIAGEVADFDGITGGFNFQAAWSTAALAAELL